MKGQVQIVRKIVVQTASTADETTITVVDKSAERASMAMIKVEKKLGLK